MKLVFNGKKFKRNVKARASEEQKKIARRAPSVPLSTEKTRRKKQKRKTKKQPHKKKATKIPFPHIYEHTGRAVSPTRREGKMKRV